MQNAEGRPEENEEKDAGHQKVRYTRTEGPNSDPGEYDSQVGRDIVPGTLPNRAHVDILMPMAPQQKKADRIRG